MAGPLNSVACAIDAVQITLRPAAASTASSSAPGAFAPDDFQSALAQARKNGATEQPGPPSSDRANDVSKAPKQARKKSEKKSRSKKAEHKKPASAIKANPKLAASDADESQVDPAADTDAAAEAHADATTDADTKAASNEIAAQQILERNLAGASAGSSSVPSQLANTNQPPSTASNGQAGGLKPLSNAALAAPKLPTKAPAANASDAAPQAAPSEDEDEAAGANPTDSTSSTATTSQAATTDSASGAKATQLRTAPAATTGLKPVATDASSTLATQGITDQSSTLNTLAALADDDSTDSVTTDAPTVAGSVSAIDPATATAGLQASSNPGSTSSTSTQNGKLPAPATLSPRPTFVAANQPGIVKAVKSELLPSGGVMHMRLDPPELGVLQVSVHVKDGVVSASFQTSNDDATKLLSRSMGELKTSLEAQGVSIGKMHVQQTPKDQAASNKDFSGNSDSSKQSSEGSSSRQDEQRRETLKRMWERLANGGDPLDLVA